MSVNKVRALFIELVAHVPPEQWDARLAALAGEDHDLRGKVAALLAAHRQADSFLEQPPAALGMTEDVVSLSGASDQVPETISVEKPGTILAGRYKLLEPIGEGGMGAVWMAQQQEPVKRLVALKLIKAGMDTKQVLARFDAERQALALMDHPNIAKVHDAGSTTEGRPFFVMELVKGVPITSYCDERHLTPRQRLELFVPVCQAIQHAHQKGVIHRDIKPGNVLVAMYDDKPVPKVIDFGVAKATGLQLSDDSVHTGFGAVVGTVEYMSPEQASFNQLDVDTRSDVYSLGVLLYELLAGAPPFSRKTLAKAGMLEILRLIREQEPQKPSTKLSTAEGLPGLASNRGTEPARLAALMRGEIDWIVMKALEKDRSRRYETASGLARDLERFLADEPVQACPPSPLYRFRKFARKHRAAMTMATVLLVSLVFGVIGLAISTLLIARSKAEVEQALEREELSSYWQRIALAEREWSANNLFQAQELLDLCPPKYRGWEWNYLNRLPGKALEPLRHDGKVRTIAISPDGRQIAAVDFDGIATLWDATTGDRLPFAPRHDKPIHCLAYSPNGEWLATGNRAAKGNDKDKAEVKVWHVQTGKELARWEVTSSGIRGLEFTADGKLACSGGDPDGRLTRIHEPLTGNVLPAVGPIANAFLRMAFTPDGKLLAGTRLAHPVEVWDLRTGQRVHSLSDGRGQWCMALSRDGQLLAAGFGEDDDKSVPRKVIVWEVQSGQKRLELDRVNARSVAFSHDGSRLATGDTDGAVKIWDVASGHEILTLGRHLDWVCGLAFTPDGHRLVSASDDMTIRVWDARPLREGEKIGQELFTLTGHGNSVKAVAFHPTEPRLATASADGTVKLWDTRTGKLEQGKSMPFKKADTVAFSPDGKLLAAAGEYRSAGVILDAKTLEVVHPIKGRGGWMMKVAFSPDGKTLATAANSGTVVLHDVTTWKDLAEFTGHRRPIWDLAFQPQAARPLLASTDSMRGLVYVWTTQPPSQKPIQILDLRGSAMAVAFSPDGRLLATGSADRMIRVYDTTTWSMVERWLDPSGAVNSLAFHPKDGRLLAWGATDSTVKVWQRESGEVVTLRGHTDWVWGIAFSPDGRLIASASNDGTARIWETPKLSER